MGNSQGSSQPKPAMTKAQQAKQRAEQANLRVLATKQTASKLESVKQKAAQTMYVEEQTAASTATASTTDYSAAVSILRRIKPSIVNTTTDTRWTSAHNAAEQVYSMATQAQTQLDRGGGAFTKADYIAVLMRLQPNRFAIGSLVDLTLNDIRALIRTVIYDVDTMPTFPAATAASEPTAPPFQLLDFAPNDSNSSYATAAAAATTTIDDDDDKKNK